MAVKSYKYVANIPKKAQSFIQWNLANILPSNPGLLKIIFKEDTKKQVLVGQLQTRAQFIYKTQE